MITRFRRGGKVPRVCDPGCDCDRCETERLERERDGLNNGAGCGPWMLLAVGYIVALTAIGISLIIISTELAR